MYPILGAVRMSHAAQPANEPPLYTLFQRREGEGGAFERYDPVGAFLDTPPPADEITALVPNAEQAKMQKFK